jgi:hypothetical protein
MLDIYAPNSSAIKSTTKDRRKEISSKRKHLDAYIDASMTVAPEYWDATMLPE